MKLFKLVASLAISSLALSSLLIPATATPSSAATEHDGFNISFEEITDGSQRYLQWSHTNCIPVTGETATVDYTMTKDGTHIHLNGLTQLQLQPDDAGTYHLDAVCTYSQWLQPVKKSMELTVTALPQTPEPPANNPQEDGPFTLYFDKVGEGDDAKLTWRTEGCRAPRPAEITLTRDNTPVNIENTHELALKDQPAGTYTMHATCSPEWLVPTTLTKSIDVTPSQPAEPDQPTPQPQPTPDKDMSIDVAEFNESLAGRTLSWNVSGCSVKNEKTVNVSVLFNGHKVELLRSSRTESVNASQWPTGVYTIEAQCQSLADQQVYATQSRDITLSRANLPVTFAGEPLNYLIPRPGDRVRISTQPLHHQLVLSDGTTAEPFAPGEDIELFVAFDDSSERTSLGHITADANGHADTTMWIPLNDDAKSFTIFAIGATHKYQLDYRSLLTTKPPYGITASKADATVRNIRVSSYRNDELSSDNAFTKNSTITVKVLDPSGKRVMSVPATTTNDGSLDTVISLPSGLADGRYTVLASTPLGLRGDYAAYFYLKDNEAWAQWNEPPTPQAESHAWKLSYPELTVKQQGTAEGTLIATLFGKDRGVPHGITYALGTNAPTWVSVDPKTGTITVTPDEYVATQNYTFMVIATHSDGIKAELPVNVTVLPASAPQPDSYAWALSYPDLTIKQRETAKLDVIATLFGKDRGMPQGITFTAGPQMPSWLSVDSQSGTITVHPDEYVELRDYRFSVTAMYADDLYKNIPVNIKVVEADPQTSFPLFPLKPAKEIIPALTLTPALPRTDHAQEPQEPQQEQATKKEQLQTPSVVTGQSANLAQTGFAGLNLAGFALLLIATGSLLRYKRQS